MHPTKSQKPLKQQPKNPGRRNREERESRDKAENERKQARAAAAAADAAVEAAGRRAQYGIPSLSTQQQTPQQPYQQRKRLQPTRGGRGGFMGERGSRLDQQTSQDAGFDSGKNENGAPVPTSPRSLRARQSGNTAGNAAVSAHSPTIVKKELGSFGSMSINGDTRMGNTESDTDGKLKDENADEGDLTSDHDETAEDNQFNVEFINLISDDEDDGSGRTGSEKDTTSGERRRVSALAPVRLQRREHEERNIAVSTSKDAMHASGQSQHNREDTNASTSRDKSSKRGDAAEFSGNPRRWKGVYEDEDEEDGSISKWKMGETIQLDRSADAAKPFRRGTSNEADEYDDSSDGHSHGEDSEVGIRVNRSARSSHGKVQEPAVIKKETAQPVFHTVAEKREWERHESDLRTMREELGHIHMEESNTANNQSSTRKDAVYLFQFPPILANLHSPAVKVEETNATDSTTSTAQSDAREANDGANNATAKVEQDPVEIKDDGGEDADSAPRRDDPRFPPGHVGKLRIRQSGRAELIWGGNTLEVNVGTEATFPQTPMLMRYNNSNGRNVRGSENETEYHGDAICMGQVRGKLIVTPDWDKLLR